MGELLGILGSTAEAVSRPVSETRSSTEPKKESPAKTGGANPEDVRASLRDNGDKVSIGNRTVEFSYDEDLHRVIVKVFSSESEPPKVVRQIPAEEYLTFAARYRELHGILFDEQA